MRLVLREFEPSRNVFHQRQEVGQRAPTLDRLGSAAMAVFDWALAGRAFADGLRLEPNNRLLAKKASEAKSRAAYEAACRSAQMKLQRRALILALRKA